MTEQYNAKTFYDPNRGSLTVHSAEEEEIARKRGWKREYPHNVVIQESDEPPEHPTVTAVKKDVSQQVTGLKSDLDAANAKIAELEAKVDKLSTSVGTPSDDIAERN